MPLIPVNCLPNFEIALNSFTHERGYPNCFVSCDLAFLSGFCTGLGVLSLVWRVRLRSGSGV